MSRTSLQRLPAALPGQRGALPRRIPTCLVARRERCPGSCPHPTGATRGFDGFPVFSKHYKDMTAVLCAHSVAPGPGACSTVLNFKGYWVVPLGPWTIRAAPRSAWLLSHSSCFDFSPRSLKTTHTQIPLLVLMPENGG